MTFSGNGTSASGAVDLVSRIEEIRLDAVSLLDVAEYFAGRSHFVYLDSRLRENRLGRYSLIAFDPFLIFTSWGNRVRLRYRDKVEERAVDNIFDQLNTVLRRYRLPGGAGGEISPFLGGGIGYFAYELGRQIESLPATTRDLLGIPECYVCFYDHVIIYDHDKEKAYISCLDHRAEDALSRLGRLREEVKAISPGFYRSRETAGGWKRWAVNNGERTFRSDFSRQEYLDAVNRIKEYILAGDVYQVNITQRFETDMTGIPPWELYKRLMHINPSPFAAYLKFEGVTVVSSSPERFLAVRGRYVETRPIKGTVGRGRNTREDKKNMEWLMNSEKNRAELAMIVDLMRNDLGRVCRAGTIKVLAFPQLESYSSVHHLVATVCGRLDRNRNVVDVLKAAFPGGSVTGAPKIRAMEIIDELEPVERGVYTGSIGYLGFNGWADLNIVIRTILVTGNRAHIQVGGGIVADSVDTDEYDETLLKARKLFKAFLREK